MVEEERFHSLAFCFKNFWAKKINYKIHNKEFLAIMNLFQEWHQFFEGASYHLIAYIDLKNLGYFIFVHVLNHHQTHWNILLSCFDFILIYQLQKQQGLSNVLSQKSHVTLREEKTTCNEQRTIFLKFKQFLVLTSIIVVQVESSFFYYVCTTLNTYLLVLDIECCSKKDLDKFKFVDDLL